MNSFGSNQSYCLICCCSDSANDVLEFTTSNSSTRTSRLIKATEKIFRCLSLPQEHFQKVKDNNWMSFCSKCILIIEEIIELQRKSEILELKIQWKVDTLARIAIIDTVPGSKGKKLLGDEGVAEVSQVFKVPVTRNFLQGLLPNPSVKLRKTVNIDTKAFMALGQIRDVIYSGDSKSSKSKTYCKRSGQLAASEIDDVDDRTSHSSIWDIWEEPIKTEEDEEMVKVEVTEDIQGEEYDSNDDLFEVVALLPVPARNEKNKVGEMKEKALEAFEILENAEIICAQEEETKCHTVTTTSKILVEPTSDISPVENSNKKASKPSVNSMKSRKRLHLHPDKTKKSSRENCHQKLSSHYMEFHDKLESLVRENKPVRIDIDYVIPVRFGKATFEKENSSEEICDSGGEVNLIEDEDKDEDEDTRCSKRKRPVRAGVSKNVKAVSNTAQEETNFDPESDGFSKAGSQDNLSSSESESDKKQEKRRNRHNTRLENRKKIVWQKKLKKMSSITSKAKKCLRAKRKIAKPKESDDPNLKEIPEGLTEGKDYLRCPKCEFFILAQKTKTYKYVCDRRKFLRRNLAAHYAEHHTPVEKSDFSTTSDGEEFYKCTKCSFRTIIRESGKELRKYSYRLLCLHYVDIHDAFEIQNTHLDKLRNLVEMVDYFRCPDTNCKFYVVLDKKQSGKRIQQARNQVMNHFNSCHNPEIRNVLLKSVLDEAVGIVCFRCSKCDFKSVVEKEVTEAKARITMKFHFITKHIQGWRTFETLYKYNVAKDNCGEDDVVRCPHPKCDYFKKIKYVEGVPREKSSYRAYNGVRHHAKFHEKKSPQDKGYSGKSLPLYKAGNEKFLFPIRANFSVQKNSRDEDIANECVTTNCDNSEPSNQTESLSEKIYKDDTFELKSGPSSEHTNNLRRSNRTLAIKRKRYNVEDFVTSQGGYNEHSVRDERHEFEEESGDSISEKAVATNSRSKIKRRVTENETGKLSTSKATLERLKYPENDHYRCWKCDFYVEVNYKMGNGKKGLGSCRDKARHKLSIHFNATHNCEELAFHDPDKLKVVIDGKDCFRCPRCDHSEEIKFNPKKHADKIQGRKNARYNLGHHFFFGHSVPERYKDTSPIPQDDIIDQKKHSEVTEFPSLDSLNDKLGEGHQKKISDPKMCNFEMAEGPMLKERLLQSSSECKDQCSDKVLASSDSNKPLQTGVPSIVR